MLRVISKSVFLLGLVSAVSTAYAADTGTKTYSIINLQRVVSNHESCKATFQGLQQLAKQPIVLQFSPKADQLNFDVVDKQGKLVNHTYKIVQQDVTDKTVNRVGMGSFELNNKKVDYLVEIASDLNKQDFKYLYPIIFSSESSHCYYTALLKPDAKTIENFKKQIQSGSAQKTNDLATG